MRKTIGFAVAVGVLGAMAGAAGRADDPLAAAIDRWGVYLRGNTSTDPDWAQLRASVEPALGRAEEALRGGHRLLALVRLAAVEENLGASAYVTSHGAAARDARAFEREWERMGGELRDYVPGVSAAGLEPIHPAAVRAVAEAAAAKARVYYQASLEYGRNTAPQYGLFYLGAARAQRDIVELCRKIAGAEATHPPPLRPLLEEIEALEGDLLRAYRPPASIDRHAEFIAASATLKEARELDALGLRYGALLRYLQAAVRVAPLGAAPPSLDAPALAERLRALESRLVAGAAGSGPRADHSIGRALLEQARAEADAAPGHRSETASAIVTDAAPRYFAALGPAAAPAAPAPARVTVTLVRWPYT